MKTSILITYDLHAPEYEDDLLEYIKGHKHTKLCGSSYVIMSSRTVRQVRDRIRDLVGGSDNITCFVFRAKRPWAGCGPDKADTFEWLKENLVDSDPD